MAAVSFTIESGAEVHQASIGSSAPSAGAIEIKIASGTTHEEIRRLIVVAQQVIRQRLIQG